MAYRDYGWRGRDWDVEDRLGREGYYGGGYYGYGREGDYEGYGGRWGADPWSGAPSYRTGASDLDLLVTRRYPGWGGFGTQGGYGYQGTIGGQSGIYGAQGRESYAGRGPKGYRRSDERINEEVCERLSLNPDLDASDMEVTVRDGQVTLSGTVEDRRAKRLAEDIAEQVWGVTEVRNELRVERGGEDWRDRGARAGAIAPESSPAREREVERTAEGEAESPQEGTEVRRATRRSTTEAPTKT